MFRQTFRLLVFTFVLTSFAAPLRAQAAEDQIFKDIPLTKRQWNTGPGGTTHTSQCVKTLIVPIPDSCKGKKVGYEIHGNDPNQGSQCRMWIVFDKNQGHTTPLQLSIKGDAALSGSAGTVPATPVRQLHVTCSAGRFTPMQLSLSMYCAGGKAEDAFSKDLDKFLQTN